MMDIAHNSSKAAAAAAAAAASAWRKTYVASDTGDTGGVQSTSLGLPDSARFTTSLALSSDQPLLAVGSGSHETNMFFVQSLDDQLDVKASFASKFPIYALAMHGGLLLAGTDRSTSVLYRVDRARLLGYSEEGTADGPLVRCVGTFKSKAARSVDVAAPGSHAPTRRVACVDFSGDASFLACVGGVVSVWDAAHSAQPLRVERVSPQPLTRAVWSPHTAAAATLVAAAGVDGGAAVVDLRRRGRAVAWRTAIGGGGACVNDVAWSPLVPHWLATAGEDGAVRVWDLRYAAGAGAPAATVRHVTSAGVPRRVAWSPTHVDLLSVGTSDRAWRLHALREPAMGDDDVAGGDSRVVAECRAADDVGAVVAACAKGSTFYTLSACGDLFAHRVTPHALSRAAAHRLADGDAGDGSVLSRAESAVYARDIRAAADAVLSAHSDGNSSSGSSDEGQAALCELFAAKPRLAAAASAWALPATLDGPGDGGGGASEARRAWLADLRRLGYGLPPDFPLEAAAARHPAVLRALERLSAAGLRATLDGLVAAAAAQQQQQKGEGDVSSSADADPASAAAWRAVVGRSQQIVQCVAADPALLDARLLRAAVKLVLPHDCVAGLTLGLGICQAYHQSQQASSSCGDLDGLVHVLLFPTVFDADSANNNNAVDGAMTMGTARVVGGAPDAHAVRQRIRECLDACADVVFEMVRLEISIQATVLKGGEQAQVAEAIVQTMKEHARTVSAMLDARRTHNQIPVQIHALYPTTTTISASAVRLYLNSLVPMRAYDEYLVNSQWWRVAAPPPPSPSSPHQNNNEDIGRVVGSDVGWPSSYPLARMINRQTATLVVPRFARQLDVVRTAVAKEPLSLEPRLYRDTLHKIARINLLMRPCSSSEEEVLTFTIPSSSTDPAASSPKTVSTGIAESLLVDAFDEIGNAFLMLLEALARHASHRDAHKRAAAEALPLHESLAKLLGERHQPPTAEVISDSSSSFAVARRAHVVASVTKYLRKLEHYANA